MTHLDLDPDDRLRARLDAAIPHPETGSDPQVVLRAGHRAARRLRRRRTAGAVGVVAAAAVIVSQLPIAPWSGGPYVRDTATAPLAPVAAAGGQDTTDRSATDRSATDRSATDRSTAGQQSVPVVTTDIPVVVDDALDAPSLTPAGQLVLPLGARLVGAVQEPLGYQAPAHSLAVAYVPQDLDAQRWTMLTLRPDWRTDGGPLTGVEEDGSGAYDQGAEDAGKTFAQWVQDQTDFGTGPLWPEHGLASDPYLTRAGELVLPEGAQLVERVDDPLPVDARSAAISWSTEGGDPRWSLLVFDPTWRQGGAAASGVDGLVNGFGSLTQDPGEGSLGAWAESLDADGLSLDAPPEWVGLP